MKPNVLFIMHDQLRYDCTGKGNGYPVKTPNLDALADDGAWFDNAYTPIPVCAPARHALYTGRRPDPDGALWNPGGIFPLLPMKRPEKPWTQSIHDAGYSTALIGLWETRGDQPDAYGFDRFVPRWNFDGEIRQKYPDLQYKNTFFGEKNPIALEDSFTHRAAQTAIDLIDQYQTEGKPWYIHIDNSEPHLPCRPSEPFASMYDPDKIPCWTSFGETFEGKPYIQKQQLYNWDLENMTWDDWKETAAAYYGVISQCDDADGRIINHLKEIGQYENTIIVFTADHGDMCGGHRLIDKHYNMYQDICHVPLTICWKGHIQHMNVKGYSHNVLDLGPTILGLLGIEKDDSVYHGRDLSAGLLSGTDCGGDFAVSTYNGQQFGLYCERMILRGDYKYVWNATDTDEFYDLSKDKDELHNAIGDPEYADVIKELRALLYEELKRCGDPIIRWIGEKQLLRGRKLLK